MTRSDIVSYYTLKAKNLEASGIKGKSTVIVDDIEIPEDFAIDILGINKNLHKSRNHKYIRRVPYTGANGKRKYRYYYKVTGGKGVGSHDEMVVGAKFRVASKDGHQEGHLTVEQIFNDTVSVKSDETGRTYVLSKKALSALLHNHHLESIKESRDKAKKIHDAASKYGSEKQKARAKERFFILQSKLDNIEGDGKGETHGKAGLISAFKAVNEAEEAIAIAEKSIKNSSSDLDKTVGTAIEFANKANKKIADYIKMLYDIGDDRKGKDAMILKKDRKNLDNSIRKLEQDIKELKAEKRKTPPKKAKVSKAQKRLDDLKNRKDQGWNLGGKTYDWLKQIKKAGGVWDADAREWLMPSLEAKESIQRMMNKEEDERREKKKKVMSEKEKRKSNGFAVRGNTYQHKDAIKRAGGMWDADSKVWLMPDEESYKKMDSLVNPEKTTMKVAAEEQAKHEQDMASNASRDTLRDVGNIISEIEATTWGKKELEGLGLLGLNATSNDLTSLTEGRAVAIKDALSELVRTNGKAGKDTETGKTIGKIQRSSGYDYAGPYVVGEVLNHPKHGIVTVESVSQKYFKYDGLSFGVGEDSGYIYSAKVRAPTLQEASDYNRKKADAELKRSQDKRVSKIGNTIMDKGEMPYFGKGNNGTQITGKIEGKTILDTSNIYGGGNSFVLDDDNETVWYVRNNWSDGDDWSRSNVTGGIGWKLKDSGLYKELQELHNAKKARGNQ